MQVEGKREIGTGGRTLFWSYHSSSSLSSSSKMSEPTTRTVEPTKVAEAAQSEAVRTDKPVLTTAVNAAEQGGDDYVEPQNDLTRKFTDAEWTSVKGLRVSDVTLTELNVLCPSRRSSLKSPKRSTDQRTLVLTSGAPN